MNTIKKNAIILHATTLLLFVIFSCNNLINKLDENTDIYTENPSYNTTEDENDTIVQDESKLTTLTFILNGGNYNENETEITIKGIPGSTLTIQNPIKENSVFVSWNPILPTVFPEKDTSYIALYKPENQNSNNSQISSFLMPIQEIIVENNKQYIVGTIERGTISVNDSIEIVGISETQKSTVLEILNFSREFINEAHIGEKILILVKTENISKGQILATPGSIRPHIKFEGEIYVLTNEEGGNPNYLFSKNSILFYFRSIGITGTINLPEYTEVSQLGYTTKIIVELNIPIGMENKLDFLIIEENKIYAYGYITEIIE